MFTPIGTVSLQTTATSTSDLDYRQETSRSAGSYNFWPSIIPVKFISQNEARWSANRRRLSLATQRNATRSRNGNNNNFY